MSDDIVSRPFLSPRIVNLVLGVWLFATAFLWPHTPPQMTNAWLCGALIALFSLVASVSPNLRYFNTAVALWLFISAFALHNGNAATFWNNLLVSIAVFFVSIGESMPRVMPHGPAAR